MKLEALGAETENITLIIDLISHVSDQTNLLALNAAIEAARAGDAGKGFAVVADEVRKLAEDSMDATNKVRESISSVTNGTEKMLEAMEKSVQSMQHVVSVATSTQGTILEIVPLMQESVVQLQTRSEITRSQMQGSTNMMQAMAKIEDITCKTQSAMTEANVSVTDLTRYMHQLQDIVNDLKK